MRGNIFLYTCVYLYYFKSYCNQFGSFPSPNIPDAGIINFKRDFKTDVTISDFPSDFKRFMLNIMCDILMKFNEHTFLSVMWFRAEYECNQYRPWFMLRIPDILISEPFSNIPSVYPFV